MADKFRLALFLETDSLEHMKEHRGTLAAVAALLNQSGFDVTLQAEYDDGESTRRTQEMGLEELAAGAPVGWDG